jgi:hypothetical protein
MIVGGVIVGGVIVGGDDNLGVVGGNLRRDVDCSSGLVWPF